MSKLLRTLTIFCLLFTILVGCTPKEAAKADVKFYESPIENLQFGMIQADAYAALGLDVPAENTIPSLDVGEILDVPTHRCTLHFTTAKDLDMFPAGTVLTSISFTVTGENKDAMLAALTEAYGAPQADGVWQSPVKPTALDAKFAAAMLMMYDPQFMLPNPRTTNAAALAAAIEKLTIPDAALPFIRLEPAGLDNLWLVTVNAGAYALHDLAKEAIS